MNDELLDLKFERSPVTLSVEDYLKRLQKVVSDHNAAIASERAAAAKAAEELQVIANCGNCTLCNQAALRALAFYEQGSK